MLAFPLPPFSPSPTPFLPFSFSSSQLSFFSLPLLAYTPPVKGGEGEGYKEVGGWSGRRSLLLFVRSLGSGLSVRSTPPQYYTISISVFGSPLPLFSLFEAGVPGSTKLTRRVSVLSEKRGGG